MAFGDFQYQTYLGGMAGQKPGSPMSMRGWERSARELMSEAAFAYVAGGASSEDTMRANLEAFHRWRLVPRMLTDVSVRDLSVDLFGRTLPAPVLLAPIGVQSIVHTDGEVAVARAAAVLGVPFVLSTASSTSMEDVAAAAGDCPRWFQLYWPTGDDLMASFVTRAEAAGYEAIVVTVDTRLLAWRPRDLDNAYLPFLMGEGVANYLSDPIFRNALDKPPEEDLPAALMHWAAQFANPALSWGRLAELKGLTQLPVLLKGILDPNDARKALDHGVDGIVVSNHGGRQVDGALAALDALPPVVDAVAGRVPVLFDSGIRTGADVCKALALGARAVLLGRPYIWGLGFGGQSGVEHVLRCVLADLDLTLALLGCDSLAGLTPDILREV